MDIENHIFESSSMSGALLLDNFIINLACYWRTRLKFNGRELSGDERDSIKGMGVRHNYSLALRLRNL